jgi:hypothetical protein
MTLQGLKRKPPKGDQKCSRFAPQLFWTLQHISTQTSFLLKVALFPQNITYLFRVNPLENRALDVIRDAKWLADTRLLQLNPDTGSRETITSHS